MKNTLLSEFRGVLLPILTLLLFTILSLYLSDILPSKATPPHQQINLIDGYDSTSTRLDSKCNIFRGNWVKYPDGPYYTNETSCAIDDRQNCMKHGRPDTEFLKWRWRPYNCELPLFDAVQFLELVRGKSMTFVGDSVARNQMESLVCLLASAANPIDVSDIPDNRFRRWFYTDYNFTLAVIWSPFLVRSQEDKPHSYQKNLYLDEADETWTAQIETVDIVIFSASQWFLRPTVYYEKGKVIGCNLCKKNMSDPTLFYGYKMAFRTAFKTLLTLQGFKGTTFLRTLSPGHYEHGVWNNGGECGRTMPFSKEEVKLEWYVLQLYKAQVKELRTAEKKGRQMGLKFRLLDTTEAMLLRPDGHPNHYGHWQLENITISDCVHWCLPGPIDTWNELLLHMLSTEREKPTSSGMNV
ncbi:hypothetical protein NMG60_11028547 [Bertholletia excelsa]